MRILSAEVFAVWPYLLLIFLVEYFVFFTLLHCFVLVSWLENPSGPRWDELGDDLMLHSTTVFQQTHNTGILHSHHTFVWLNMVGSCLLQSWSYMLENYYLQRPNYGYVSHSCILLPNIAMMFSGICMMPYSFNMLAYSVCNVYQ